VVSAGNFHGEPLAFALDFTAIAVSEIASISERRTDRILDPARSSGLPPFLARRPGLDSGYMLAQYTAAALVAENRILSHPASVDSIPTSGLQEDHVSMGWGAGRKLDQVLANAARVVAVELICAAEGIDHRAWAATTYDRWAAAPHQVASARRPITAERIPGTDWLALGRLVGNAEAEIGPLLQRDRHDALPQPVHRLRLAARLDDLHGAWLAPDARGRRGHGELRTGQALDPELLRFCQGQNSHCAGQQAQASFQCGAHERKLSRSKSVQI
jgi:hypothetical protein